MYIVWDGLNLHEDTFVRNVTFARRVIFAKTLKKNK